jgi:hypothetical protein
LEPHRQPLAVLRNPNRCPENTPEEERIDKAQNWLLPYQIGHTLDEDDRSKVDRTSSQDLGVDPECEVVVASSTLEVGFNDPSVGAIIQHKAPMEMPSYIQRKGRAGRSRMMRPWMITILSAFGRDRDAFQRYEELADPKIKALSLPIENQHIIKMQAALACLDWFGLQIQAGSIWHLLCNPNPEARYFRRANSGVSMFLLVCIEKILTEDHSRDELFRYLSKALKVSEEELESALWDPPRSIFLEFLPWLRDSLKFNWSFNGIEWGTLGLPGHEHQTGENSGGRMEIRAFFQSAPRICSRTY